MLPEYYFPDSLHVSFKTLSADVCGHRNLDRQRAPQKVEGLGQMDGPAVQEALPGQAHARAQVSRMGYWIACRPPAGLCRRRHTEYAGTLCSDLGGLNLVAGLEHFCYKLPCPIHSAFFCGMGGIPTKFRSTLFPKKLQGLLRPSPPPVVHSLWPLPGMHQRRRPRRPCRASNRSWDRAR